MFRLQIHQLLYVYGGVTLVVILFAACMHNFRRSAREKAARKGMLKCRLCAFEFSDQSGAVLPRCPNCQALTERRRLSHL